MDERIVADARASGTTDAAGERFDGVLTLIAGSGGGDLATFRLESHDWRRDKGVPRMVVKTATATVSVG